MSNSTFRDLHRDFLLLPNAWDPGSARLIESLGAKAIATTSAGMAWSRGFSDGDALPVEELLITVRAIARVIRVPLTVDIEGGYSDDPSAVAQVVTSVIEAGAVGKVKFLRAILRSRDVCSATSLVRRVRLSALLR